MLSNMNRFISNKKLLRRFFYQNYANYHKHLEESKRNHEILTSKEIRRLFLDYFVKEKGHTYVHSSPIFLNQDPTLLFVNAGMNQFRSLLSNKAQPGHPFYSLKKAANSQKCIRISGKHNDLAAVGSDLHHHTFFEMLGNWSFGDYSKREACEMAWTLLTKTYHIEPERLYVTYFGGDKDLSLPPDEECKNIWLDIGVHPDHIFPFGAQQNFWEMGNSGPCGPCTEIHYDYHPNNNDLPSVQRINADRSDMIEVWNLVFVQYNRDINGELKSTPCLNVDTGMGFERLSAILQGSMSNYDTDLFQPLFQAIEKNFKVRPYAGKTGSNDVDGLDTAYRTIVDHSRMFSVAIADGLFPDAYDAGHVLRKIIRRAAYAANRVMKSRPGLLSSLVPHVAESLSYFPEIENNTNEIIQIVNEEEKTFHQLINRGRRARNKIAAESNGNRLSGKKFWELHHNYGLEENVVQDLASEINLNIDFDDYRRFSAEKKQLHKADFKNRNKCGVYETVARMLEGKAVPHSDDSFKYNYSSQQNKYGVSEISAQIIAIVKGDDLIDYAQDGLECTLVTDKTNFYSTAGGQECDFGKISNEDFAFNVKKVYSHLGYVFHEGVISKGKINVESLVQMAVNKDHRIGCSRNHTASHLLNSALRKIFPYTTQRSSYAGSNYLRLGFSSKAPLTENQIEEIEDFVNDAIKRNLKVSSTEMPFELLLNVPNVTLLRGEEYPETVKVIWIGTEKSHYVSIEPCCGTHVHNTSDIINLAILPYKSHGGTTRVLNCVTGNQAIAVLENDKTLWKIVLHLETRVEDALKTITINEDDLELLLKEVKKILNECHVKNDISLRMQAKCEKKVFDLKLKLSDMLKSFTDKEEFNESAVDSKTRDFCKIANALRTADFPKTNDIYKYSTFEEKMQHVKTLSAKIIALYQNGLPVKEAQRGQQCQVILDKTNFYAEGDDQACDKGFIKGEGFVFQVTNVFKTNNYVVHDGWIESGSLLPNTAVHLLVDAENRLACSQNHTALHLLNSILMQLLPYSFQRSALAGHSVLSLRFSSKVALSEKQLIQTEHLMNRAIKENLEVFRNHVPVTRLNSVPSFKASLAKEYEENIPLVTVGNEQSSASSSEPCSGTHVSNTSDISQFILITYKNSKDMEKLIEGVTGAAATIVEMNGKVYHEQMTELENQVSLCLNKKEVDYLELLDCLKEVKLAKKTRDSELPLLMFKTHQRKLSELSDELTEATEKFIQTGFLKVKGEMQDILKISCHNPFIVHRLLTLGDGKRMVNSALECVQNKPAMIFAQDGHKNIICTCSVPKDHISSSFSALLWIQPVAELIEGQTRATEKDPVLHYSVISSRMDKIDQALKLANEFANIHL